MEWEVATWAERRIRGAQRIAWQFTTAGARTAICGLPALAAGSHNGTYDNAGARGLCLWRSWYRPQSDGRYEANGRPPLTHLAPSHRIRRGRTALQ